MQLLQANMQLCFRIGKIRFSGDEAHMTFAVQCDVIHEVAVRGKTLNEPPREKTNNVVFEQV